MLLVGAVTAVAALVFAGAGAGALRLVRGRSLRLALAVVALTAVGVVATSVATTSALMLLDGHTVAVVAASSLVAALAGLAVAGLLARRLERGNADLAAAARRFGGGRSGTAAPGVQRQGDVPLELAAVAAELQRTHARLEESTRRERALESSRRELVAWMSHDLRTPLAGIRAMAEALDDGVVTDPATVDGYHRQMVLEAARLGAMADDLFDLSRLTAGSQPLEMDELDVGALASSVVRASAAAAAQRGVRLVADVGDAGSGTDGAAARVLGDEAHLRRALRNLVDNAVRHTPAGGEVRVQARPAAGACLLEVADGCGGIPEADLPRVFDVGFRGESARTPGDHGAGLGLAIARGVVRAHEGDVRVVNRGPGCAFTVTLPAAPAAPVGLDDRDAVKGR